MSTTHESQIENAKRTVRRVFEEGVNERRFDRVHEAFAESYVGPNGDRGQRAFGASMEGLVRAFPDLHYAIEDAIAEGDRVVLRFSVRGTHRGTFRTFAPTGRAVSSTGIVIFQLAEGRIVRSWVENDRLGFQQQLEASA